MPISLILLGFLMPMMSLALLRILRQRQGGALASDRMRRRARPHLRAQPQARAEVAEAILRRRQQRRAVLHRVLHPPP